MRRSPCGFSESFTARISQPKHQRFLFEQSWCYGFPLIRRATTLFGIDGYLPIIMASSPLNCNLRSHFDLTRINWPKSGSLVFGLVPSTAMLCLYAIRATAQHQNCPDLVLGGEQIDHVSLTLQHWFLLCEVQVMLMSIVAQNEIQSLTQTTCLQETGRVDNA